MVGGNRQYLHLCHTNVSALDILGNKDLPLSKLNQMQNTTLKVLLSTAVFLMFTPVVAQNPNVGMSCKLKTTSVVSSQRMCVYECSDKSLEGRYTNADSKCTIRIRSDR